MAMIIALQQSQYQIAHILISTRVNITKGVDSMSITIFEGSSSFRIFLDGASVIGGLSETLHI